MERLTIEFDGNYVPVGMCSTSRDGEVDDLDGCKDYCEMVEGACESSGCVIQKCFNKLGEYEDLEEQGLLRRMTTVYGWIPADEPPKSEDYVLLSFANFSIPLVGRYEEDEGGGAYYVGDDDESCASEDVIVNAWQPLPEPYKG